MKTLVLSDRRLEAARLAREFTAPWHADQVLDEDGEAFGPDGQIEARLVRGVIPEKLRHGFELYKPVGSLLTNRPSVVGVRSREVNELVAKNLPARSIVLGWDRPGHLTPLTVKDPGALFGNERLVRLGNAHFAKYLPAFHSFQLAAIDPRWRLWNTAFSTIYVIWDHRCTYHRDGNLKGGMTALIPNGDFEGGELLLPGWGLMIAFGPGDLLIFSARELHGNLPITKGTRSSVALYCARGIGACGK